MVCATRVKIVPVLENGESYAGLARELGGWAELLDDPAETADAWRRLRRQTAEGRACQLEYITGAETTFSHCQ